MKYNFLNYDQAHAYVEQQAAKSGPNREVFWDEYDIVMWKKTPGGFMSPYGLRRNGEWGVTKRFRMTNRGTWRVPVTK